MNCPPFTGYYPEQSIKTGITKGEISEVLAKVMAVAAGQKQLQMQEELENSGTGFELDENEA